jgi:hypothetical protein
VVSGKDGGGNVGEWKLKVKSGKQKVQHAAFDLSLFALNFSLLTFFHLQGGKRWQSMPLLWIKAQRAHAL